MDLSTFVQAHPFVAAFVLGVVAAARNDYIQYKKSGPAITTDAELEQAIAKFNWKVAGVRWFHGGVAALMAAIGGDAALRSFAVGGL